MTTPTAEDSRALLERLPRGWITGSEEARRHLRAALDREVVERARTDEAETEVGRLIQCLNNANRNHEHFERQYYLAMDRAEKAEAERDAARALIRDVTDRLWEIASGDMSAYDLIDHINAVLGQEPGT